MITCKICGTQILNNQKMSRHLVKHKTSILDYYVKYENFKIPKCSYCENEAKYNKGIIFRKTCCSADCLSKDRAGEHRKHNDLTKLKLSNTQKKLVIEGKHNGWSINKDINRRSYPEKWFIKNVLEKHNLYNKYTIKEKLPFHKYFLDFAIIDLKIDIEIDGQQHFRNTKTIEYDRERDEFLLNHDWNVYRIAWLELKNNPNDLINNFLEWINENHTFRKYDINEVMNLLNPRCLIYGSRKKYFENVIEKSYEKYKPIMEIIKNSNIDFSKYGWVKEVSSLTEIREQKVGKWMKRYLKDFYEEKCFKRKLAS